VIDKFTSPYVYFFAGYWLATNVFQFARLVLENSKLAIIELIAWALINGWLVSTGFSEFPVSRGDRHSCRGSVPASILHHSAQNMGFIFVRAAANVPA